MSTNKKIRPPASGGKIAQVKVGMLSLGCARNLVDAEVILGYLKQAGFKVSGDIINADVAIVNTCCFIREAEEESIDAILKVCRLKQEGRVNKIIVCGCLAQRYQNQLIPELEEVDAFVGVGSIDKIVNVTKQLLTNRKTLAKFARLEFLYSHLSPRVILTPRHFAYVKISEGCNHRCSYCVIPDLRGKYRSRTVDSVLREVDTLFNKRGVSEINLIGQDTTMYGQDLYRQSKIAFLVRELSKKSRGRWIRLLYAHPGNFPQELTAVIKEEPAICKYIDLPLQHINDRILKKMGRETSRRQIFSLVGRLRAEIPGLAIRTTLIVGFPGETDAEFKELLDFIRQMRFERLGLFKYSRETGSRAYNFSRQVPEEVRQSRYEQALSLQQHISEKLNEGFLGKQLRVLIDEQDERDRNVFLGRSEYDAPEVDGCVYVKSQPNSRAQGQRKKSLRPGDFVEVKITDTLEYDLVGEISEDR